MVKTAEFVHDDEHFETLQDRMIDQITAGQQDAINAVETAGAAIFQGVGRAQQQFADFVADRFQADLDAQGALLRCRSLAEMRRIQLGYVRESFGRYGDEMSRLMRLGGQLAACRIAQPQP